MFAAATWDPITHRARLAAISPIGTCRQIHVYEHQPSPGHIALSTILCAVDEVGGETCRGLRQTGERVVIYTHSSEAIKTLGRTPRTGMLAHGIKIASTERCRHYGVEVRAGWEPGHAGGNGDGATEALASQHTADPSILATQTTMPAPDDPTAKMLAAKKERRCALWRHIPTNDHLRPQGLPRGAQVLIHKARAGPH